MIKTIKKNLPSWGTYTINGVSVSDFDHSVFDLTNGDLPEHMTYQLAFKAYYDSLLAEKRHELQLYDWKFTMWKAERKKELKDRGVKIYGSSDGDALLIEEWPKEMDEFKQKMFQQELELDYIRSFIDTWKMKGSFIGRVDSGRLSSPSGSAASVKGSRFITKTK